MKKLVIGLMAFSIVACGDENGNGNGNGNGPAPMNCTAAQLGSTRCEGDILQECNQNGVFAEKEDCAASTPAKVCQEFFAGVARCEEETPPAGIFDPCTGTGQGNCESADLTCGEIILLSDDNVCLTDCANDASLCNTVTRITDNTSGPGYCEPGVFADGGGQFASTAFCFQVSNRNELCLFNDDGCTGTELTCQSVTEGLNPECKLGCSGADVGTSPAGCGGQPCLRAGYVEIEDQGGNDRTCTDEGSTTQCSATYECTLVGTGENQTELLCARRAGICGNEVPSAPAFASQTEVSTYIDTDTNLCELVGIDQYCGGDAANGAVTECISSGFAFRYDPAIPCAGFDDFLGCFGIGECITFDGVNFECGAGVNVCQTLCTESDGTDIAGSGANGNPCDTGTCTTPTYPIGRPAIQFGTDDRPIECTLATSAECDTVSGFTCDDYFSDGDFCLKTRQVCSN